MGAAKAEETVVDAPSAARLRAELRAPQSLSAPRQRRERLSTWASTPPLSEAPVVVAPPKLAPSR